MFNRVMIRKKTQREFIYTRKIIIFFPVDARTQESTGGQGLLAAAEIQSIQLRLTDSFLFNSIA